VAAVAFLPIGLLSPVGGAMADRVDRRRWLLATTAGETGCAAGLALLTWSGHATAPAVTVLVLLGGCMAALGLPAFQAVLPDLVPREDLLAASSLSLAQYNLGRVIGPALAGVVLAVGSFSLAFALNAVSFGAVIVALLLVRLPPPSPDRDEAGLWRRIVAGARGAAAEPGCRLAIMGIAVTALLLSPFIALVPAVALKHFHNAKAGTSVLITAQGLGAVLGALVLASLAARYGRRRLLVADLAFLPVVVIAYAAAPTLALAALAILMLGAAYIGVLSGLGTVVQLRAPAELRARILSLYMVALGVVYPLGAVIQGFLGDRLGLRTVTAGAAVIFLVIVLTVRVLRPGLAAAFDDPVAEEPMVDDVALAPPPSPVSPGGGM
jgi:MFS family permease